MGVKYSNSLGAANKLKYLKAPTRKEVISFIEKLGVSDNQFERFFGIPFNTITQIRRGARNLPAKYWHVIYEKNVPAYSAEYQAHKKRTLTNLLPTNQNRTPDSVEQSHPANDTDFNDEKLIELLR